MKKTKIIKGIVLFTATAILASSCLVSYAGSGFDKEEIVKISLAPSGEMRETIIVNTISPRDGVIEDFGNYDKIRNIVSQDKLKYDGRKISGKTTQEEFIYTGRVKEPVVPWNVKIRYKLDGQEVDPKDIAGKDGKFQMNINVTENEECSGTFFKDYSLSLMFDLDNKIYSNVRASDATVMTVGDKRNVSAIALPDKGLNITIAADVHLFELPEITIRATKASKTDANFDDSNIRSSMDDMQDIKNDVGVEKDDDLGKVDRGDMSKKVDEFREKTDELADGITKLKDGVQDLVNGAADVEAGAASVNKGALEMQSVILQLADGLGQLDVAMADTMANNPASIPYLQGYYGAVAQSSMGASQALSGAVDLADGTMELLDGSISLYEGASELNDKSADLSEGSDKMIDGASEIKEETDKLNKELDKLEKRVDDKMAEMDEKTEDTKKRIDEAYDNIDSEITRLKNGDEEPDTVSFASADNTNVSNVQFEMKTDTVDYVKSYKEVKAESKTLWQKILEFFGISK